MTTLVKSKDNKQLKININKEIIDIYLKKINECQNKQLNHLDDLTLKNALFGLYFKNNIILKLFISKQDINYDDYYILDTIKYNISFIKHFINPEMFLNHINVIIESCNNYLSIVYKNYQKLNMLEYKINIKQENMRINNKMCYIEYFKYYLSLKDTVNIIKNDIYNDINFIYLQAIYIKYDILMAKNLDELTNFFIKLEELKKDLNNLKIPFSFEGISCNTFTMNNGKFDIEKIINLVESTIEEKKFNIRFL